MSRPRITRRATRNHKFVRAVPAGVTTDTKRLTAAWDTVVVGAAVTFAIILADLFAAELFVGVPTYGVGLFEFKLAVFSSLAFAGLVALFGRTSFRS